MCSPNVSMVNKRSKNMMSNKMKKYDENNDISVVLVTVKLKVTYISFITISR